MIKRLRFKFVLINMVIVSVMLCVIFGLIYNFTRSNLERGSISLMEAAAQRPFMPDAPGQRGEGMNLPYFTLQLGRDGELIATGSGYYDLSDEDFLRQLYEAADSGEKRIGVLRDYDLRYYRSNSPGGQSIVFADVSIERNTLSDLMETCALIGGLSLLLFLGISLLLASWAVKPVEQAWLQQRQFVADASHELKTPLTVILTNAELIQCGEQDRQSVSRFSANILTMSQQMRSLVEQLLELARADSLRDAPKLGTLELSPVISDSVLPFEPLIYEKGLSLEQDVDEGIWVKGDGARLRELMEILLDNAQKYSSPGGCVRVSLKRQGRSHCRIVVANHGAAMTGAELKNIFKRFYRSDEARSGGGFGLGLSIAESIAQLHRGRIWAQSADGVNSFITELPCTQQ